MEARFLALRYDGKGRKEFAFNDRGRLNDGDFPASFVFQTAHGNPINSTRSDGEKRRQAFFGDIDREAVHGDPFSNTHADGGELAVFHPNTGESLAATGVDAEVLAGADQGVFEFSQMFVTHLLTRNNRVEDDLIDQLFNSSEKRLARLLLLLANFGKEGAPTPITASINQETLAEMIGTTRSRVSFFMNKFRKLGLIDYNGHIEVHRSLLNAVLYDKPQLRDAADIDPKKL